MNESDIGAHVGARCTQVLCACLLAALLGSCADIPGSEEDARNRVTQFFTKLHNGQLMQAEDWLARETLEDPAFGAFGGLTRMTSQVAGRSARCGGVRSIDITAFSREGARFRMTVHVNFREPSKCQDILAAATTEPEIWQVIALQEGGAWKLIL